MIPLRWRLTLWHLVLTALGLLGFILISYRVLSDSLRAEVNNTLAERANHVADAVAVVPNRPIEGISQEATDEFRSPGIYVQLFNTDGVVVAHSFNLGAQQLPAPVADINRALAGFVLVYFLFSRLFPIVSVWETAHTEGAEHPSPAPLHPAHPAASEA